MKALVMGSSNSVKATGWVAGLSAAGIEVTNVSCGASSGLQFTAYIGMDFSLYDYVFFDSLVNDELDYLQLGHYENLDKLSHLYFELFSTISFQSSLIIINFPFLRTLNKESYEKNKLSPILKLRNFLANATGAQCIDIESIMNSYAIKLGVSYHQLFEDPYHPQPHYMYEVGRLLGEKIQTIAKSEVEILFKKPIRQFSDNYITVPAKNLLPCTETIVSNSMLEETFYEISAISINLEDYAHFQLVGFYLIFPNSASYLELESGAASKTLLTGWTPEQPGIIHKVFFTPPDLMNVKVIHRSTHTESSHFDYEHPLATWRRLFHPALETSEGASPLLAKDFIFRKNKLQHDYLSLLDHDFDECLLHRLLVLKLMDNKIYEAQPYHGKTLKAFDGSSFFFDIKRNVCVLLPGRLVACDPRPLTPVQMTVHANKKISFHVNECGRQTELHITHNALRLKNTQEDTDAPLETLYPIETHGDFFAVRNNGYYFRALLSHPDFGMVNDATELSNWSLFKYS
ncbi:hypothetical protein ACTUVN_003080 [Pseudomonas caspiana]